MDIVNPSHAGAHRIQKGLAQEYTRGKKFLKRTTAVSHIMQSYF